MKQETSVVISISAFLLAVLAAFVWWYTGKFTLISVEDFEGSQQIVMRKRNKFLVATLFTSESAAGQVITTVSSGLEVVVPLDYVNNIATIRDTETDQKTKYNWKKKRLV